MVREKIGEWGGEALNNLQLAATCVLVNGIAAAFGKKNKNLDHSIESVS